MLILYALGFLNGLIAGVSPCILPVLPVIMAGSAAGTERRRPYMILAGLVVSFSIFALIGIALIQALDLPKTTLKYLGVALLLVLAVALIVPQVWEWIERPFTRLGAKRTIGSAGSFVLGLSLGLVAAPCAGPVLAAISAADANHQFGFTTLLLSFTFGIGMAVPLLIVAVVVRKTTAGWKRLREHLPMVRRVAGVVMAVMALAIVLTVTEPLSTHLPGYTNALQNDIKSSASVKRSLHQISGERTNSFLAAQKAAASALPDLGKAPTFVGITRWLNTPGDRSLTLSGLRGKVVLVDFWTYSCINCRRTLPHLEAWYAKYHKYGFDIVGVHTPEFPFEYEVSNVRTAAASLGVHYPIAIDDKYATWDAYGNTSWPSEYLVDQNGQVRHAETSEGRYTTTERDIRLLLSADGVHNLPPPTDVANHTPTVTLTPETYLGSERFDATRYEGLPLVAGKASTYTLSKQISLDDVSFAGSWTQQQWQITANADSGEKDEIVLGYMAHDVYLVLGGTGTVRVSVNGKFSRTIHVSGVPDTYAVVTGANYREGVLSLQVPPGIKAYDFTFG